MSSELMACRAALSDAHGALAGLAGLSLPRTASLDELRSAARERLDKLLAERDALKADLVAVRACFDGERQASAGHFGAFEKVCADHAKLKARLEALEQWAPTPAAVNALPGPLRRYVADLVTRCDPAGEVRERALLADGLRAIAAKRPQKLSAAEYEAERWGAMGRADDAEESAGESAAAAAYDDCADLADAALAAARGEEGA